jgi:hypothetical protein
MLRLVRFDMYRSGSQNQTLVQEFISNSMRLQGGTPVMFAQLDMFMTRSELARLKKLKSLSFGQPTTMRLRS